MRSAEQVPAPGASPRRTRDSGTISGFVAAATIGLIACVALVFDGGRLLGTRLTASDHAENAARVGAQAITSIRGGSYEIDPAAGASLAEEYLDLHGIDGSAQATPQNVIVTVHMTYEPTLLRLVGASGRDVVVTRRAIVVDR
jgi:hypothetical protein